MTLAEVAALSYFQPERLPPGLPPGLEAMGRYKAALPWNYANATHICTCEVAFTPVGSRCCATSSARTAVP
jgi:carbon-monoxide dehydrogenase large subunit